MQKFMICFLLVCTLLFVGCDDSDNIVTASKDVDGLSLLGLVNGRTLVYLQTDTTISPDTYSIIVSDTILSVLITGSGNDWIVHKGSERLISLKVASTSVIQNGYWKKFNNQDSLMYFSSPPLLFERTLNIDMNWEYYTPYYYPDLAPKYLPYYFSNFGYRVDKTYTGIETIITPAGEFDAYRFDLLLYTSVFGENPIAVISEFYVPNVGLVKQSFNIGVLKRTIILANYSD